MVKMDDVQGFVAEMQKFHGPDTKITYNNKRELIQLVEGHAHTDVWLYTIEGPLLKNDDYTTRAPTRLLADTLPTQKAVWLGREVKIPAMPQKLMEAEYGKTFMTPRVIGMECFEQFWNRRVSIGWWNAVSVMLLVTLCIQ